jgi:predicted Rossmann fold flavoprotein
MKVIVIGGGPAGMMAAITAADQGHKVIIIEKNKEFGRKLLITGKGRCNITSSIDIDEFVKNIPGNGKFLYSAFNNFTNLDIIDFLIKNGVRVKVERGNRVFPDTDKSQDVLKAFEKAISKRKIQIIKIQELQIYY